MAVSGGSTVISILPHYMRRAKSSLDSPTGGGVLVVILMVKKEVLVPLRVFSLLRSTAELLR